MNRRLRAAIVLGLLPMVACGKTIFVSPRPPGEVADDFSQVTVGVVDILWVIDDSGSMADKQQNVHDNLNSFFHYLVDAKVDFHVAVATTDTTLNNAGLLVPVGAPQIITTSTPNALSAFQKLVEVGTSGNALDTELAAAVDVLQANPPGFIRSDAYLYIIWVSDQADSSYPGDPLYFYRYFAGLKGKGNNAMVNAGAITGDLPSAANPIGGCYEAGNGEAPSGLRLGQVVELMDNPTVAVTEGGVDGGLPDGGTNYPAIPPTLASICSPSFADVLENMGIQAVGLQRGFKLSIVPATSTLKVTIGYPCGTVQSSFSNFCSTAPDSTCGSTGGSISCVMKQDTATPPAGDGWTYQSSTNEIWFDIAAIPPKGATIEVSYYQVGHVPN